MKENERLQSKIERLASVYGNGEASAPLNSLNNAKSLTELKAERDLKKVNEESSQKATKSKIPSTIKSNAEVTISGAPASKAIIDNEELRKELSNLDKELHDLKTEDKVKQPDVVKTATVKKVDNDALKKELSALDKEIGSLSKKTKHKK